MTSPLVLDGGEIKLRLQAERQSSGVPVHVDWLRFTVFTRNHVPTFAPLVEDCEFIPHPLAETFRDMPKRLQEEKIAFLLAQHQKRDPDALEFDQLCQALELAREVTQALGPDFQVAGELRKGKDFYRHIWPIERHGHQCGWVGFGATNESPDAASQAGTIHANIEGHALTFAKPGAAERLADLVDLHQARITRVDLALDFFNGMGRCMETILQEYRDGLFNVRGKKPACEVSGGWPNYRARSIYVGCRKSGKVTNIYEKGHQLFGADSTDPWVRVELRFGNKLRVLSSDTLRRPADFFAGASDWHQSALLLAGEHVQAQVIPCDKALPAQTVKAEVSRNVNWAFRAAAQTISAAFRFLDELQFLELCNWQTKKLPGRLRRFSDAELRPAFQAVMGSFSSAGGFSPTPAHAV